MSSKSSQHPILDHLLSNNAKWAEELGRTDPDFFPDSAKGQTPPVLWIGCADSRVPESVITGARPGNIFVHRNIANQVHLNDNSILSVIAYAVGALGVQHVVVVGHSECGGAAACLQAAQNSTSTDKSITTFPSMTTDAPLNAWLDPLTNHVRSLQLSDVPTEKALPIVVEENVKLQVDNVSKAQSIADAWSKNKQVWVHGWVYDLSAGRLRDLGISRGP